MKILIIIISILTVNISNAQRPDRLNFYKASNGITYKNGDEIILKKGTAQNLKYESIRYGYFVGEKDKLTPANQGSTLTILEIQTSPDNSFVQFMVTGPTTTFVYKHYLDIEKAITTCEIENCIEEVESTKIMSVKKNADTIKNITEKQNVNLNKYDKLRELKKLFDEGVLTEKEYQTEKKKILDSD